MRWCFLLAVALFGLVQCIRSSGNRLLVVIEEDAEKDQYSQFWGDLKDRGYILSFESPKNEKLSLIKHGVREFDHVIILPTKSKGYGPSLTPKLLLEFVNSEGNIFLALSGESSIPSAISSFLLEFDIQLPPDKQTSTIDHFHYDTLSASEKHDVLLLPRPGAPRSDVKSFFGGDGTLALPHAVPQTLGNDSPLLQPILKAKATAYSYSEKEESAYSEDPFAVGEQIALISALQARNSARFTVFGSLEALQNKWFDANIKAPGGSKMKTVNREFAKQVTQWAFKETGVIKVGKVVHRLSSDSTSSIEKNLTQLSNPTMYRVKNDVTFNIELSEYVSTHFAPPSLPAGDHIQLEFTMLSPFHRLNLAPISSGPNSTVYSAEFVVPDQHGIFTFKVNYKRPFLTNVDFREEVTVRHFAHDEFPRSWLISGGWVWIAGIWVTIAGWVAFVAVWLYSEPRGDRGGIGSKKRR